VSWKSDCARIELDLCDMEWVQPVWLQLSRDRKSLKWRENGVGVETGTQLESITSCVPVSSPVSSPLATARTLGLEYSLRPPGRPPRSPVE
jgi:hypothetical protein